MVKATIPIHERAPQSCDFVALKTQAAKQEKADQIYYAFREFFPRLNEQTGSLDEALAEMLRYARYYAAFSLGRGVTGDRSQHLARLRHLVDVPAILVMRLFECRDHTHTLTEEEFLSSLGILESYILRRAICDYQTRVIGRFLLVLPIKQVTKAR
jgi:hypothetical protein